MLEKANSIFQLVTERQLTGELNAIVETVEQLAIICLLESFAKGNSLEIPSLDILITSEKQANSKTETLPKSVGQGINLRPELGMERSTPYYLTTLKA